jgi:hypothetical protein
MEVRVVTGPGACGSVGGKNVVAEETGSSGDVKNAPMGTGVGLEIPNMVPRNKAVLGLN